MDGVRRGRTGNEIATLQRTARSVNTPVVVRGHLGELCDAGPVESVRAEGWGGGFTREADPRAQRGGSGPTDVNGPGRDTGGREMALQPQGMGRGAVSVLPRRV